MIGIINYGLGNLLAFKNSFGIIGKSSKILNFPHEFEKCTHLVLPGVGSFDYAIECLRNSNIYKSVEKSVLEEKKPILGVCSGMQIMFQRSEEGVKSGLGWIEGEVLKFSDNLMMHIPYYKILNDQKNLTPPHSSVFRKLKILVFLKTACLIECLAFQYREL